MSRTRSGAPLVQGRIVPFAGAAVTLVAGLAVHAADGIAFSDKLGDVLYAAFAAFGLWFLFPASRRRWWAGAAAVWCLGVELLQLTGLPAAAARAVPASRLVLGVGFDPLDLLAYAVGIALALACSLLPMRSSGGSLRLYDSDPPP